MKPENQDALAFDSLEWAFSGKRDMPARQHRQVKAAISEARSANRETPGKRRSRFWGFGPTWGSLA